MRAVVQPTLLPTQWPSLATRSVAAAAVAGTAQTTKRTQSIHHVSTTCPARTLSETAGATTTIRITAVTASRAIAGRKNALAATTIDVVVETAS